MSSETKQRYVGTWALFLVFAVSLLYHVQYLPYAEDDAYIHMRIAAHLLFHGTPYYNLGSPVMTSTAPLWIAITAPLALLGPYQALGIAVLNAVITTVTTLVWVQLFWIIVPQSGSRATCLVGIIIWATLLTSSLSLMETPFAMLLTGAGLLNLANGGRWGLTMLGLAIFVRPECLLYGIAGTVYGLRTHRGISKSAIGYALGAILIVALSQLYFFGTVIPHTAIVKSIVYRLTSSEFIKLVTFSAYGSALASTLIPGLVCCLMVLLVIRLLSKQPQSQRKAPCEILHKELALTTIIPALLILSVYAMRSVAVFPWYTPLFLVPLHGAAFTLLLFPRFIDRAIGTVLLLPLGALTILLVVGIGHKGLYPFFDSGARVRTYLELGKQLHATYGDVTLCAPEIGGLGYTFTGPILDAIGLASPQAVKFHPLRVPDQRSAGFLGAIPSALVESEHPDLIAGLDIFMEDLLRSNAVNEYERVTLLPILADDEDRAPGSKPFGASKLLVLTKKGLPVFEPNKPLQALEN